MESGGVDAARRLRVPVPRPFSTHGRDLGRKTHHALLPGVHSRDRRRRGDPGPGRSRKPGGARTSKGCGPPTASRRGIAPDRRASRSAEAAPSRRNPPPSPFKSDGGFGLRISSLFPGGDPDGAGAKQRRFRLGIHRIAASTSPGAQPQDVPVGLRRPGSRPRRDQGDLVPILRERVGRVRHSRTGGEVARGHQRETRFHRWLEFEIMEEISRERQTR